MDYNEYLKYAADCLEAGLFDKEEIEDHPRHLRDAADYFSRMEEELEKYRLIHEAANSLCRRMEEEFEKPSIIKRIESIAGGKSWNRLREKHWKTV